MNASPLLRLSLAALLAPGLFGCGRNGPSTPVTTAKVEESTGASGGKQLTVAGISLTFPADWEVFNLTQGDLDKVLAPLENQPRGKEMAQAVRAGAANGMVKMFVFDPKGSKPGFMNNANLVVTPGVGNATLDQALDASKKQIEALGFQASASKVTFPAGEFGRLESHLKAPDGAPYTAIGYVQVHDGEVDVVTFSCPPDQVGLFDAKAASIMKSFKRS